MRWSNVPIPEPHVAALVAAAGLHATVPLKLPIGCGAGRIIGGPMLAAGIGLAVWAVSSAGDADVEREEELVTDGAYALSRNPMYVGWSTGVVGLALWTRSAWLLGASILAASTVDREIDIEETRLLGRFGSAYGAYRERVPRYVGRPRLTISLD
jgi:protein-S-isoprenylcysteine O-methyltransferase Ste14